MTRRVMGGARIEVVEENFAADKGFEGESGKHVEAETAE